MCAVVGGLGGTAQCLRAVPCSITANCRECYATSCHVMSFRVVSFHAMPCSGMSWAVISDDSPLMRSVHHHRMRAPHPSKSLAQASQNSQADVVVVQYHRGMIPLPLPSRHPPPPPPSPPSRARKFPLFVRSQGAHHALWHDSTDLFLYFPNGRAKQAWCSALREAAQPNSPDMGWQVRASWLCGGLLCHLAYRCKPLDSSVLWWALPCAPNRLISAV